MSSSLPADVVLDIMARLPVKSVMRLRLVSKSFFSVTAASNFISSHLALSRSSGYVVLPWKDDSQPSIAILDKSFSEVLRPEIPFSFISQSALEFGCLVGSCNGVLCFLDSRIAYSGRDVVLWNPMIRKFKKVTDTSLNYVMLHDATTKITLGLGFDGINNDHIIVRIVISRYEPSPQAEIYSLRTHSWRQVIFPMNSLSRIFRIGSYKCSFDHGALYWTADVSAEPNTLNDSIIISFEIQDEQFKVINLPDDHVRGTLDFSLMVLKRSLVVAILDEVIEEVCRVWKMEKHEETEYWTEQHNPSTHVSFIYGCTEDGELMLCQEGFKVSFYNPETGILKASSMDNVYSIAPFQESLVLL